MKIRMILPLVSLLFMGLYLGGCNACTAQHNPTEDRKLFVKESETANRPQALLNEDGSYPEAEEITASTTEVKVASSNPAQDKYMQFCSACHGADGKATGPSAQALNPKPRNLTLVSWHDSVSDEHIYKVIKDGGMAVGLSATMAPWGGVLNEEELKGMVELVRSFKGK